MRVKVEPTTADIKYGKKAEAECCAIARAYKRAVKSCLAPGITLRQVYVEPGEHAIEYEDSHGERHIADAPNSIRLSRWVKKFDTTPKTQMKPAKFWMIVPDEIIA